MSVTQIDLDDPALAEAMRLMGVTTKKETVNAALRDYVDRVKRLEAAERPAARGARGEFEQAAAAHDTVPGFPRADRQNCPHRPGGAASRARDHMARSAAAEATSPSRSRDSRMSATDAGGLSRLSAICRTAE